MNGNLELLEKDIARVEQQRMALLTPSQQYMFDDYHPLSELHLYPGAGIKRCRTTYENSL